MTILEKAPKVTPAAPAAPAAPAGYIPGATPQERFANAMKMQGTPLPEKSVTPQVHTPATLQHFAIRDAQHNPPETTPTPEQRIAELNADLQRAGLQRHDAPFTVDQRALDKLTSIYRALPAAERDAKRAVYERDLQSIYEGRRIGESLEAFKARRSAPAEVAAETPAFAEAAIAPSDPSKYAFDAIADERGFVDVNAFRPEMLSGYTLPRLVQDQRYSANAVEMLATARRAGFTQQQVNDFVAAQMRADGWIK